MISRFFIDRPIFANVIAIITVLFGAVALYQLPVERYPPITPPTVIVTTNFPGGNARTVADTVAAPIEQQINGVENMMYMSSTSSSDASYSLTITFEIGTNLDDAQVLVQNRLAVAEPQLPEEVRRQGVTVKKQSSNIVLAISLTAPPPKDRYDLTFDPGALKDLALTPEAVFATLVGQGMKAEPQIWAIRGSSRYRSSNSSQNGKKLGTGTQSSSRIIPSPSPSRNQSIAPATPLRHPTFSVRNRVSTRQSQSTSAASARTSATLSASSGRWARGPSDAM